MLRGRQSNFFNLCSFKRHQKMMFTKYVNFHIMRCVAWEQEYTYVHIYIHTWVFKQECTWQAYICPYLGLWLFLAIKIASECVLISITVKFLLKKKTEYTPCVQCNKMAHGNVLKMVATASKAGVVFMPYPNIKSSCMTDGFNPCYICIYSCS